MLPVIIRLAIRLQIYGKCRVWQEIGAENARSGWKCATEGLSASCFSWGYLPERAGFSLWKSYILAAQMYILAAQMCILAAQMYILARKMKFLGGERKAFVVEEAVLAPYEGKGSVGMIGKMPARLAGCGGLRAFQFVVY